MTVITEAVAFSAFIYDEQIDNFGQPRVFHALRVMESVRAQGAPDHVIAAAVLHDVLEHGDADRALVAATFGDEIAQIVWCVSRREGEPIERFDARCGTFAETKLIRRADLHDKLSQLPLDPEEDSDLQKAQRDKATKSLMRLPA